MPVPKLLVVDDEQVVSQSCTRIFGDAGFKVDVSSDAEQGLIRALGEQYQAILLDIRLPGMDGLDFLEKLRAEDRNVPVIIITGYSSVASASAAMRLGATDYIPKPFTPDEIMGAVMRLLPGASTTIAAPEPGATSWVAASEGVVFGAEGWVQQGLDGSVRVGTVRSRREAGHLSGLCLPEVGAVVYRGLPMATFELRDALGGIQTKVVASPITGKVSVVNAAAKQGPALLSEDPCDGGWLARLAPLRLAEELRACAPRRVVVATDDELLGRRELRRLGCRVRTARFMEEACEALRDTGTRVLMVDARSFGAAGPALVGRTLAELPGLKVVVLGAAGSEGETAYREKGIFYYAIEPFADGEIADLMQVLFSPPLTAAPPRSKAPGLPRWVRKLSIINRRGERITLLASRGILEEPAGIGGLLLDAVRKAGLPVQVTLGYGSVSLLDIQREATRADRVVVLSVDDRGRLAGSLSRAAGAELAPRIGERADRVVALSIQPGPVSADSLEVSPRTAEALAEHILAELL